MRKSNFISKILNGWKVILFFLVVASLLAIKYNYFIAKKFQSVAQVKSGGLVGENQTSILSKSLSMTGLFPGSTDAASLNAVNNAVSKQELHVEYYQVEPLFKSELYNYSPIKVSYSLKDSNFYKLAFDFNYAGSNNFLLTYEYNGIKRERAGVFGKEIHETSCNFTVNKNQNLIPARTEELLNKNLQFIIYSEKALAESLLKSSIDISSQNGIATVTVTSGIPEKAQLLANSVSESLLEKNNSSANLDLLNQQLSIVTSELDNAQNAVAKYKVENQISDIPMQTDAQLTHLENLEMQKMDLDLQSLALDNLSDYLRKNRINGNAAPDYGTITDPVFAEYITKLNGKIAEQNNNSSNATLQTEINYLKNTIAEGIRNTRKKVALQKDEINKQIAVTKTGFSVWPEKEGDLQTLNRNLYLVEKLYNYLVDKRTEAMYAISLPLAQSDFIQKASLPHEPVNAEASTVWILAILLGLITGGIAVIILNKFKKETITNRKAIDVQQSIPYFGSIDNVSKINLSKQFKSICTKLLVLREEGEKQIITITSASAGEGKSFIATQLAKSLATLDLKVLMMDMNLSNQVVENIFDVKANYTLADVFQKQTDLQEAIQITSIPNLDILIAGELTNGINNLIATNKLNQILNELKKQYDFIIIDTTNTTSAIDAIPLMKMSNTNLFVVKSGADANSIFENAEQIKSEYKIENLFFVLNKTSGIANYPATKSTNKTARHKNSENQEQHIAERRPFLKKVALWFY